VGELLSWLAVLAGGLVVTITLTVSTSILTVALSTVLAVVAISPSRVGRVAVRCYVDLFRSIPLLALLIFADFGIGAVTERLGISTLWLAVAALTLNSAAYLSEIYRAGLLAVSPSQWEDATTLGLTWRQTTIFVVIPQAFPAAVPTTLNSVIGIIKLTSLASLMGVGEVTLVATTLVSSTFQPFQVYVVLGMLYLAMIIPLTLLSKRIERRLVTQ
jgi:His/Glu/Gln/Arg/opine family amino acid ABC transporter permease subunit